ncbi:hypothetical protein DET54_114105 [Paenibacillus pabuli]|uniref:Apea-like HEPN domain-containing protein n=1 Tax=Paenibacillus pabuli TaxID=1472 RepID=A0ABX9BF12_9BACL|nr:hypothetical protein [Paenibacillus pabuli]RAI89637.1 hypothetical protein DET54_114105 [Paenibacillus pabuli]
MSGGLYGHRNIEDERLKEWINTWYAEDYINFFRNNYGVRMKAEFEDSLSKQVEIVKQVSSSITVAEGRYLFDDVMKYMTPAMFYCYFRYDSSTAYCGNYYEVLIEFADESTKKKLIKGYDYVQTGGITLEKNGEVIGHIGQMSDLFWHTFYDKYIVEDDYGAIEHARNNEKDITLQIWNDKLFENTGQFYKFIEQILFECNVYLDLGFKRSRFESASKLKGQATKTQLCLSGSDLEETPLRYFNFANYTKIPRHKYLAYYQVLEFFFTRAVKEARLPKPNELLIIKYITNNSITASEVISWLEEITDRGRHYTEPSEIYPALIPLNVRENVQSVATRIYTVRCSLIHSKEAPKDVNFIPNLNDEIIDKELALIKYVAEKVLYKWSNAPE